MKSLGSLYHFTSVETIIEIISTNVIILKDTSMGLPRNTDKISDKFTYKLSLTRNKHFDMESRPALGNEMEAALIFDGDRLSEFYKIVPFNYYAFDPDLLQAYPEGREKSNYWLESEEMLLSNQEAIDGINKFIKGIMITTNVGDIEKLKRIAHKRNIPIIKR